MDARVKARANHDWDENSSGPRVLRRVDRIRDGACCARTGNPCRPRSEAGAVRQSEPSRNALRALRAWKVHP